MIGDLIQAAAGLFQGQQAKKMSKQQIQFRVADAKAAGISPLAALGANIQPVGSQPLLGDSALAGLKNIGDQLAPPEAQRLANEETRARIRATEAQTMETVARSRTIAMGARQPPGAVVGTTARPGRGGGVPGSPPQNPELGLGVFGRLGADPSVADAQAVQDRYGDIAENLHGLGVALPHDVARAFRQWLRGRRASRRRIYRADDGALYPELDQYTPPWVRRGGR